MFDGLSSMALWNVVSAVDSSPAASNASPASTSALTYTLYFSNSAGGSGAVDFNTYVLGSNGFGQITLMEIGA